jgi:hypothetical protein
MKASKVINQADDDDNVANKLAAKQWLCTQRPLLGNAPTCTQE